MRRVPRPSSSFALAMLLAPSLPLCALSLACDAEPEATGSRKAPAPNKAEPNQSAPGKSAAGDAKAPTVATPGTPAPTPSQPAPAGDPPPVADTSPHAFGVLDMLAMDRLSDPQLDGKGNVVFVRRVTDMPANRGRTDLWRVAVTGGQPTRLTDHPDADDSPRIAPDGTIYFVSGRSGSAQVWKLPAGGGEPVQVTALALPIASLALSPDGSTLAFAADVFVDCGKDGASVLDCTKARLDEATASPSTGVLYDHMFVRHGDSWSDGRRSHLFTMPTAGGPAVDVTATYQILLI